MATPRIHDEARDQEVLRANRELAAYFRGKRTEREARAALKIIKAFIRDRQQMAADKRRPLPVTNSSPPARKKIVAKRKPAPRKRQRSTVGRETMVEAAQPEGRKDGEE